MPLALLIWLVSFFYRAAYTCPIFGVMFSSIGAPRSHSIHAIWRKTIWTCRQQRLSRVMTLTLATRERLICHETATLLFVNAAWGKHLQKVLGAHIINISIRETSASERDVCFMMTRPVRIIITVRGQLGQLKHLMNNKKPLNIIFETMRFQASFVFIFWMLVYLYVCMQCSHVISQWWSMDEATLHKIVMYRTSNWLGGWSR